MDKLLLYGLLKNKSGAEISASGNPAVLEGTVEGRAIKDAKIFGWSKQNSTTGEQLLDISYERTDMGVLTKFESSIVTFNGTISEDSDNRISVDTAVTLKPGKYHISSTNPVLLADFVIKKANGNTLYSSTVEIDGSELSTKVRIILSRSAHSKGLVVNETTNVMLNAGDTRLPWEPYTGGQPSPSPDYPQEIISTGSIGKINMGVFGRNLIGKWEYGTINADTGIAFPYKKISTSIYSGYIPVDSSKTYKLSMSNASTSVTSKGRAYDAELAYLGAFVMNIWKIDMPKGTKYIRYVYEETKQGDAEKIMNGTAGIMLNIGTTALPYEPYSEPQSLSIQTPNSLPGIPVATGGNYTDADGQQWIADYVDLARGKYVQNILKWHFNDVGNFANSNVWHLSISKLNIDGTKKSFSNMFKVEDGSYNGVKEYELYIARDGMASCINMRGMTENEMREWLNNNDPEVLSVLATPIEHDLTQEELEAYKNLTTCAGTTVIENDQDCYMEVSATTGYTLRAKKLALLLGD